MASKFIAKYPVPDEFPDILHDFAREVLRDQPDDIYEYGAQYFKALYNVSRLIIKGLDRLIALIELLSHLKLRGKHPQYQL